MKKPEFKLNLHYEFSKREKALLYVMGIALLIVAVIFLVFFPGLNKYEKLSSERNDAMFKQQEMELAIGALETNKRNKISADTNLTAKKESFSKKMNNDELDNMLTSLVVDEGFKAQDLAIVSNEITSVPSFESSEKSQSEEQQTEEEAKDLETAEGTTTSTESSTTTTTGEITKGIYIGTVTMTIQGTISQFENLVDIVNNRSDVQIIAYEIGPISEKTSRSTVTSISNIESGKNSIVVTFNVYMVDKPVAE